MGLAVFAALGTARAADDQTREQYAAMEDAREMSQTARNLTRITFNDNNDAPDVAPDGKEIVFQHQEGGFSNLFRTSAAGGAALIRVTNDPVNDYAPRWSPDGRSIFFSSNRVGGWRIWEIAANGLGGVTMVSPGATSELLPDISPAGLVVLSGRTWRTEANEWGPAYLWTVRTDGTRLTMIRPGLGARWSPDGKQWVFQLTDQSGFDQLFLMNADGSHVTQITNGASHHRRPSWSPDGKWILYQDDKAGNYDIWVIRPDGTSATQLTTNASYDGDAVWSKDGRFIFFVSNRGKHWEIWRMEPVLPTTNTPGH